MQQYSILGIIRFCQNKTQNVSPNRNKNKMGSEVKMSILKIESNKKTTQLKQPTSKKRPIILSSPHIPSFSITQAERGVCSKNPLKSTSTFILLHYSPTKPQTHNLSQ